jgi:hypothetical protein
MSTIGEAQHVAGFDIQTMRGRRTYYRGVVPRQLGDGFRHLLQPAKIGEPAVVDSGVGPESHFQSPSRALRRGFGGTCGFQRWRLQRQRRAGNQAIVYRPPPPALEIRALALRLPIALHDRERRRVRLLRHHLQNLCRGPSVVQRLNQRLLDADRAVERPCIAPGFE